VAVDGLSGLWRGTAPAAARAALLTASQCATYDVVKAALRRQTGASDGLPLQVAAGAITGVVTTTVTAPADVLKTRMFAGGTGGVMEATRKLVAEEGFTALFKGWTANYVRLGPQTMIVFLVAEQLRRAFGLVAL
jgi:solute carrier family 25 (mitochondrial uncoupling protein), member 8/9